jgi:hypothetical protein
LSYLNGATNEPARLLRCLEHVDGSTRHLDGVQCHTCLLGLDAL